MPRQRFVRVFDPDGPGFRLGKKKIYLPNHTITFIRKDRVPANWATFHVPLTFTKFDIRDYLWNIYNVKTTGVRSWVDSSKAVRKPRGGYYRPPPKKFMMVQLVKPFVWPKPPTDLEPWNKKLWQARTDSATEHFKAQAKIQAGRLPYPSEQGRDSTPRKRLAAQAEALLSGEKQWVEPDNLDSKWDKIAEAAKREREARAKKANIERDERARAEKQAKKERTEKLRQEREERREKAKMEAAVKEGEKQ
ncbi:54S ribosomal protein L23, mitochondrial protein 1 [Colletotrichum kahawae]|uniref:Large ribosomal subunit protein uL23m n=1 Tax=Colletotrichum kahawae TaxID=34407 RepID=A0AAE0CZ69_COLKA|nr:54S ribosomal protein L23, mitochondrial protein 1 [Colletotrichum kahawae]